MKEQMKDSICVWLGLFGMIVAICGIALIIEKEYVSAYILYALSFISLVYPTMRFIKEIRK